MNPDRPHRCALWVTGGAEKGWMKLHSVRDVDLSQVQTFVDKGFALKPLYVPVGFKSKKRLGGGKRGGTQIKEFGERLYIFFLTSAVLSLYL